MTIPTPQSTRLSAASARVATAKAVTVAAQAALNGDPGAGRMATEALAEPDAARSDLNRLQNAPPAVGIWAEYARFSEEQR